jgi:hypothetical protein
MEPIRHEPPYDGDAEEPTVGIDPHHLSGGSPGAVGAEPPTGPEIRAAHLPTVAEERMVARSAAQTRANVNRQIIGVVGIIAGAIIWALGSPAPGITVIVATFALTIAMVMAGR